MRLTILALGTRGDVQPLLALAQALQKAGYSICFATHLPFQTMVMQAGVEFHLITANIMEIFKAKAGKTLLAAWRHPLQRLVEWRGLVDSLMPLFNQIGRDCLAACRGANAIIYSHLSWYFAPSIAEYLQVPLLAAFLHPEYVSAAFPSYISPSRHSLGNSLNRLSWQLWDAILWFPMRLPINQWRSSLGLAPIPEFFSYPQTIRRLPHPVIFGYSPQIMAKPADWGEKLHLTGYWFLERDKTWQAPPALVDFLANGSKPLYLGFGSMISDHAKDLTQLILQALEITGQRAIFATGWGALLPNNLPKTVFAIEEIPHDWLLPQIQGIVHHGGAGTTAAALRAGIPATIIPFFADQSFWADRMEKLGVATPMLPYRQLTLERLVKSINQLSNDERLLANAALLSEKLKQEDGLANAVKIIQQQFPLAMPA